MDRSPRDTHSTNSGTVHDVHGKPHASTPTHTRTPRVHVLHEPEYSDSSISFDIVAVHHWHGSWDLSWTYGNGGFEGVWLKDALRPILPWCRIISYQSTNIAYDLAHRDASDLQRDLMHNRRIFNRSKAPIILIGLLNSGAYIKQLYISTQESSRPDVRNFHACIRGFAFFFAPQNDQAEGEMQRKILAAPKIIHWLLMISFSEFRALKSMHKQIPRINRDFEAVRDDKIECVCFYDTANFVDTVNGREKPGPFIGESVATFRSGIGVNVPLPLDASRLRKFKSLDDPNLTTVVDALQALYTRAAHSVPTAATAVDVESSGPVSNGDLGSSQSTNAEESNASG